jgi:hypothetical protein
MGAGEIMHRVREWWQHREDATFADHLEEVDLGHAMPQVPLLPHVTTVPWDLRVALKTDATDLLKGDWELFGWRMAAVGTPPCWHRDASTGVIVAPEGLSWKLDHRNLPDGADARTIWEINRWSQMTRLAMHGWVAKDLSAIEAAQGWINDWCDRNPAGHGINWTSNLEVALRLINFTWFDALVSATANDAAIARQKRLAQRVLPAHTLWVKRYLSFGSSANNHLLGELVGLLHAVKRWPALESRVGNANAIWDAIADCVMQQFAADGGNREQALHYHLFAMELAWCARRLMVVHRADVTERLKAAAEYFVRMLHPAEGWDYGDSDDAQVLPLTMNRRDAASEWQAWLAGAGEKSGLGFWFGNTALRGLSSEEVWWTAPHSGMAVGESAGWLMRADASPLGYGSIAAHGHMDALHVSLWDGMEALIIDPGTGGYHGLKKHRTALASAEAHNGPVPSGGWKRPRRLGTFLWSGPHPTPSMAKVEKHSLEMRLKHENFQFTRKTFVTEEGIVVVEDEELGGQEFDLNWCISPDCTLQVIDDANWLLKRAGAAWQMSASSALGLGSEVRELVVARHYGRLEPTVCIRIHCHGSAVTRWWRVSS